MSLRPPPLLGSSTRLHVTTIGDWTFPCGEVLLVNPHLRVRCTPPNRSVPWASVRLQLPYPVVAVLDLLPPAEFLPYHDAAPWPVARESSLSGIYISSLPEE